MNFPHIFYQTKTFSSKQINFKAIIRIYYPIIGKNIIKHALRI